ncbi:ABC transporter permease subunit [Pseudomonas lalucatii]|nr:ABC transporter permease subunit [Pseudomonas lalucatii]MBS7726273.1 ABC transporter permease subunit [Pseudomonas lalucatii]QVM88829.1 ABC transporter permease subunit [Pseudomonas lalucatii]
MAEIVSPLFWPSPQAVWNKFVLIATEGYKGFTLAEHLGISLYRVLAGFGLGCLLGIPVGLGMGLNKVIKGWMDPLIEFYRPVPPLAYVPLVIIWMGIGDSGKVLLLFLATFSIIVISARAGVASVAIEKIHAAYSLGASRWQILRHVILINALPEIFTGMRVAMGVCWGTLVAAEMVAATSGVGWMVLNASRYLNTDIVLMGVILMGVVGFMIDLCMRRLEQKLIPWKSKGRG